MTDEQGTADTAGAAREVVVARFRPHARRLFWPAVLVVATCAGAGFGVGVFQAGLAWLNVAVGILAVVLIVAGGLLPVLRWLGERYVLTTRRLVVVRGLFVRTRQELLHARGYEVVVRRAGLQTLFRSGDVILHSGLERPLVLADVPSADLVLTVLHDLMEATMTPLTPSSTPPDLGDTGAGHAGEQTFWIDRH